MDCFIGTGSRYFPSLFFFTLPFIDELSLKQANAADSVPFLNVEANTCLEVLLFYLVLAFEFVGQYFFIFFAEIYT